MKKSARNIIVLSSLPVMLSLLSFGAQASSPPTPSDLGFSLELFRKTVETVPDNTVLISPFSIYLALGMVTNGSTGANKLEMCKVLGIAPDQLEQMNSRNKSNLKSLEANKQNTLEIANALFADASTPFIHEFLATIKSIYGAEAQNLDFGKKVKTLNTINAWCNSKTNGEISTVLSGLDKDEKMILLNAIYFKGRWADKFEKNLTKDEDFTLLSGKTCKVKMMHSYVNRSYLRGTNFAAVSMPYVGRKQSMYIFLPDKGEDFSTFQKQFTEPNWNKWMNSFADRGVTLSLPKMKLDFEMSLKPPLQSMGMNLAFVDQAGTFEKLISSRYRAWISKVIHKTFMDVSEEGTVAAAATAVVVKVHQMADAPEIDPAIFKVDRPFVLAIKDNETNELLFIGDVLKP